jgi:hypothetical protein
MPKGKQNQSKKQKPKQPVMYRQKRRNRQDTAFTVIDGQRIHLGVYGTPEAEKEYRRVVAEWNAGVIAPRQANSVGVTVAELVLRFLKERQNKVSATQWDNERNTAAVLVELYGDMDAATFDINCLRVARNEFIQRGFVRKKEGYVRQKINWRVQVIRRVFRWGTSFKIVPSAVWNELRSLGRVDTTLASFCRHRYTS